jgi:SpoVK/Ycf46/Vps4 family AAA+-type ATPase
MAPSIIFFDELDGLAPVRNNKQNQVVTNAPQKKRTIIFGNLVFSFLMPPSLRVCVYQVHSSIVSTLLSLMDSIDDRGTVFVIAATNRIDNIDPALRRLVYILSAAKCLCVGFKDADYDVLKPLSWDVIYCRPGRFDRELAVPLPTADQRASIAQLYTEGKLLFFV